jgi:hypothetical protein
MSIQTQALFHLTAVFGISVAACSAPMSRSPASSSQNPIECAGSIVRSAADAAAYTACDSVNGDLRIRGTELSDLSAFASLRRVSGTLEITSNARLGELSGLEQLSSVGALEIRSNPVLGDVDELGSLRSAGFVNIVGNPELETLRGLEGLQQTESLRLQRNGIYNTSGLDNLREVGTLVVTHNSKLISLAGLKGLRSAKSVEIRKNPVLAAYFGLLPQLQKVEQELVLHSNSGLSKREVRAVLERVERGRALADRAHSHEAAMR